MAVSLFLGEFCVALSDFVYDLRLGQGGGVADVVVLALGDLPQDPSHDLSGSGLGQGAAEEGVLGNGETGDLSLDHRLELPHQLVLFGLVVPQVLFEAGHF